MKHLHRVQINIAGPDGQRQTVMRSRKHKLPERLIRLLFGEAREIVVLDPGETVHSVVVQELKGGAGDGQ